MRATIVASSSESAATADNLLFPVTAADFESAESILPLSLSLPRPSFPPFRPSDFHASHAFTAFTAGIDITWTKVDADQTRMPRPPEPSSSSRLANAHVINLDLRWNSEIVNHDKCSLQSFPSACSRTRHPFTGWVVYNDVSKKKEKMM